MKDKKHLVVLTGAGISAESGISTFRGSDGLWEGHDIMEVASPEGWESDMENVLRFYNLRRTQLATVEPNLGHLALKELEEHFHVSIITQNVDNLHERAESSNILHLHGELTKVRSTKNENLIYDIGYKELNKGDLCDEGAQLRPHIVWFGEMVPALQSAKKICQTADYIAVIGTSMIVYPAAALIYFVPPYTPLFVIDPEIPDIVDYGGKIHRIAEKASIGVPKMKSMLL